MPTTPNLAEELEKSILEESKIEETEPVYAWDAITSIASAINDQSKKAVQTYRKELTEFFTAVKEEAGEAFNIQEQAIRTQIGEIASGLDTSVPVKIKEEAGGFLKYIGGIIFEDEDDETQAQTVEKNLEILELDSTFFTTDHSVEAPWTDFMASPEPTLLLAHKEAILLNDTKLNGLHAELVPGFITEEIFWQIWCYNNFLRKHNLNPKEKPPRSPQSMNDTKIAASDWVSWEQGGEQNQAKNEAEKLAPQTNSKEDLSNEMASTTDGWDEWD